MKRLTWILAVLLFGCTTGTQDINLDNPNDPLGASDLDAPENVRAVVGDGRLTLSWEPPPGDIEPAVYAVYRREIAPDDSEGYRKLREVTERTYTDVTVRNGRVYGYQIAAGEEAGGPYGKRSQELEARPALFSMVLEGGARITNDPDVSISFNAPRNPESFKLGEDPDLEGIPFQRFTSTTTWELSPGEGMRTLYAVFRFEDGAETDVIQSSIELDTRAFIGLVDFSGEAVRSPGDVIRFSVDGGEPKGEAYVEVGSVFPRVDLFDDGTHGDQVADDGVYEGQAVVAADKRAEHVVVEGFFIDLAGNTATSLEAARTLTISKVPESVALSEPLFSQPPDEPEITLRWSRVSMPDFDAYELYRSDSAVVDSSDRKVGSTSDQNTLELADADVVEGETYAYRVYVRNEVGLLAGSNTVLAEVPNLRHPAAADLQATDGVTESSIGLKWNSVDDGDFAAYWIYRAQDSYVDGDDELVASITLKETELHTDSGLRENTEYSYRVYTVDTAGLTTPGSQISATTANLPPNPVVLAEGADVDTAAVTLSWSVSDAHDFSSYKVYRDEGPGVGTFSTLVVEIEDQDVLEFRDTELEADYVYYYRVFVFDDGAAEERAGSNVISVKTDAAN